MNLNICFLFFKWQYPNAESMNEVLDPGGVVEICQESSVRRKVRGAIV